MRQSFGLLALLLSACVSPEPYKPSRELVDSIPRPNALAALRKLLPRATPYTRAQLVGVINPLQVVRVDDAGFAFRWSDLFGRYEQVSYTYTGIAPQAYAFMGTYFVALKGWSGGLIDPYAGNDCIYFEKREDLEMFLEALASLR